MRILILVVASLLVSMGLGACTKSNSASAPNSMIQSHILASSGGSCPTGANYLNPTNPTGPHVALSSLGITNCFYVAASGSDSNSGTSETTPWLHAPGMPNCGGICASVTPSAGMGIIFRGGDTWHFGNSSASPYVGGQWYFGNSWNGTASNMVYIGVDQSWYSGGSWARPILNGDNPLSTSAVASCAYPISGIGNAYVELAYSANQIFDNFEFTGYCWSTSAATAYIMYHGANSGPLNNIYVQNNYAHGWTHTVAGTQGAGAAYLSSNGYIVGSVTQFNIVDGSDSDDHSLGAFGQGGDGYIVRYNYLRHYGGTSVFDSCHYVHDNVFEYVNNVSDDSTHTDVTFCYGEYKGAASDPNLFFNNIWRNIGTEYNQPQNYTLANDTPTGQTDYVFDNVAYNNQPNSANNWITDDDGCGSACSGTTIYFNNTASVSPALQQIGQGQYGTIIATNNHWITSGGMSSVFGGDHNVTETFALYMTPATAASQGYTAGNNYAPTSSSNSTVTTAGTNLTSYCKAFAYPSGIAACEAGTTNACSYNSTNHTVTCPVVTPVSRPSSGSWNIGAYQFGSGSGPAPTPVPPAPTPVPTPVPPNPTPMPTSVPAPNPPTNLRLVGAS
jgi:hypothetical protein